LRAYVETQRAEWDARLKHGGRYAYEIGCRCDACRGRWNDYHRKARNRRAAQVDRARMSSSTGRSAPIEIMAAAAHPATRHRPTGTAPDPAGPSPDDPSARASGPDRAHDRVVHVEPVRRWLDHSLAGVVPATTQHKGEAGHTRRSSSRHSSRTTRAAVTLDRTFTTQFGHSVGPLRRSTCRRRLGLPTHAWARARGPEICPRRCRSHPLLGPATRALSLRTGQAYSGPRGSTQSSWSGPADPAWATPALPVAVDVSGEASGVHASTALQGCP
jgi:hypothetical protein